MTDIVERLRGGKFSGHDAALDLMDDAADEIERLRKALEFYAKDHKIPSEGPWGIDSDDFGDVARAALEGKCYLNLNT